MARRKIKPKSKGGRPSKFDERFIDEAEKLALLGATDANLSDFFKISLATLDNWKKQHPKFLEALKRGKSIADGDVAQSLYRRATGYSHEAVKIFNDQGQPMVVPFTEHYPPDTTAAIFWLKNRRPDLWRDKTEVLNKNEPAAGDERMPTALEMAREIAFALRLGMAEAEKAQKSEPSDTPTKH